MSDIRPLATVAYLRRVKTARDKLDDALHLVNEAAKLLAMAKAKADRAYGRATAAAVRSTEQGAAGAVLHIANILASEENRS
jgi:hypothetical protein